MSQEININNHLITIQVYNFRPAGIIPFLPLKPTQTFYKSYRYIGWLLSVMKVITPNFIVTLKDLAVAMINSSLTGYSKNILEVKDIKILAKAQYQNQSNVLGKV